MKTEQFIAIAGLAGLAAWILFNKKESSVGRLSDGQKFIRRGGDLIDLYKQGKNGQLNGGDVTFEGERARIAKHIRAAADADSIQLPEYTDRVSDIRKAYQYSKRQEGGAFWNTTGSIGTKRECNFFISYWLGWLGIPERGECKTEKDGYSQALANTAYGNKWLWTGKGTSKKGIAELCFASRGSIPEEKKAYRTIISNTGISPELFAEAITDFNGDVSPVLNGVIEALKDAPTKAQAIEIMRGYVSRNKTEAQPTVEELPF